MPLSELVTWEVVAAGVAALLAIALFGLVVIRLVKAAWRAARPLLSSGRDPDRLPDILARGVEGRPRRPDGEGTRVGPDHEDEATEISVAAARQLVTTLRRPGGDAVDADSAEALERGIAEAAARQRIAAQ